MSIIENNSEEINEIREFVKEGRIDDAVKEIGAYINESNEVNYIDRIENVIETILQEHGGKTVLRFLIENVIIDIPSLLENLSKKDSILRYSFLLLLKSMCENESNLFLPFADELLNSDDPNVREAFLQLLIFIEGGEKKIKEEDILLNIARKLNDEQEFVVSKAIQLLKIIGNDSPSLTTKILTTYLKSNPENEQLKANIDNILKSIVSIEKIDEIIEEEAIAGGQEEGIKAPASEKSQDFEIKDGKIQEKEKSNIKEEKMLEPSIKQKEAEIAMKSIELQEKEKQVLEGGEDSVKQVELAKEEKEIKDKELELKKKELELKRRELELQEKEKTLEEKKLDEKEKALLHKEELLEKEKILSQVEIELQKKAIEEKERKIKEEEQKRIQERLDEHNKKYDTSP